MITHHRCTTGYPSKNLHILLVSARFRLCCSQEPNETHHHYNCHLRWRTTDTCRCHVKLPKSTCSVVICLFVFSLFVCLFACLLVYIIILYVSSVALSCCQAALDWEFATLDWFNVALRQHGLSRTQDGRLDFDTAPELRPRTDERSHIFIMPCEAVLQQTAGWRSLFDRLAPVVTTCASDEQEVF